MTRTALAAPDEDPDDPDYETLSRLLADAMAVSNMPVRRRWATSKAAKRIVGPDLMVIHAPLGSGKTMLAAQTVMIMEAKRYCPTSGSRRWYARKSPQRLAGLAVRIAGRERAALADEWRAHLSGETGRGLSQERQLRDAAEFLLAAIRCRLQDAADIAWWPVDKMLGSRELSNLMVLAATLGMAVTFISHGGLYNLAVNIQSVAAVWIAAYALVRVGRKWRGVKPPKHKPRRIED